MMGREVMTRCKCCKLITIANIRNALKVHDSLLSLKASAEQGCHFCNLCWTCLLQQNVGRPKFDLLLKSNNSVWLHAGSVQNMYGSYGERNILVAVLPGQPDSWSGYLGSDVHAHGHLDIFATQDSPLSKCLIGRSTTIDPLDSLHIALIKGWLNNCSVHHGSFCGALLAPPMPTRVIDVRSSTNKEPPFLKITNSLPAQYIALSYVWGPNGHEVLLTHDTIKELQKVIDPTKLSKTFADAIQLTRDLGIQYLWTDALCIMQGDPIDWEIESKKMADIFGNAHLTIVAGSAATAGDGFLKTPFQRSLPPCPLKYEHASETNPDLGDCYVWLPRSVRAGPVEQRAWCFQEDILSPRKIVYGSEQMFFRCQRATFREDGKFDSAPVMKQGKLYNMPNAQSILGDPSLLPTKDVMLHYWYKLLLEYTARDMTNTRDKFPALSGFASLVRKILGCRYLGGLWEIDIIRGLSWMPAWTYPSLRTRGRPVTRPVASQKERVLDRTIRAPSWSWAVVDGTTFVALLNESVWCNPINFRIWPANQESRLWTLENSHTSSTDACELHVQGVLKRVRVLAKSVDENRGNLFKYFSEAIPPLISQTWGNSGSFPLTSADANQCENTDGHTNVIGFGWFDILEEKGDSVFCVRLVREQGLMLEEISPGKFQRLGGFVVTTDGQRWFDEQQPRDFSLV